MSLSDFLKFEVSFYAALIAVVVALVYYRRLSASEMPAVIVILIYGLTELVAGFIGHGAKNNIWFYNMMLIPQVLFLNYAITGKLNAVKTRKVLTITCYILLLLHSVNLSWFQGVDHFANFTYIPVSIFISVISFLFLKQKLGSIDESPFNSLLTWLAIASLLDNAAASPILTILGWRDMIASENIYRLFRIVTYLYAGWYIVNIAGIIYVAPKNKKAG